MKRTVLLATLSTFVLLTFNNLSTAGINDGLVAHWPFDGNANEVTGNAPDGSVDGATLVADRFGNASSAYSFDGTNDSIVMSQDQFISGNTVSVAFWVKPGSLTGLRYYMMCSDFGIWQWNSDLGMAISHPATESGSGEVPDLTSWYHFVGTFDGEDIRVYIDGQLKEVNNHPGDIDDLDRDLTLGVFSSTYWQGTLDDIRIYDRALTAGEISDLANNNISNIVFSPSSPQDLAYGTHIDISYDYYTTDPGGVRIFARPFTDGSLTPGYSASGSALHPQGTGSETHYFTINSGNAIVDQVRFRMTNDDKSELYLEFFVPVEYYFPETEPSPTGDLAIESRWTESPPIIDGTLGSGEWDDAPSLPLYDDIGWERGTLYVLNDHESFYILVDVTDDITDDLPADDEHSGIGVDIGLDEVKTPYVDMRYAAAGGTETLGIQRAVSVSSWTGLGSTTSQFAEGYGARPDSGEPNHTFYEYKLDFAELGIDYEDILANPGALYQARINIQAHSLTPNISIAYPASETGDWDRPMIRIALDAGELVVGSKEPIISGIGLIPRTYIDQTNGLATTGAGHQLNVQDAPFGAHMRVIGNIERLRDYGVNYFAIGYCNLSTSSCPTLNSAQFDWSDWQFVQDTRSNYYWEEDTHRYVLENTGTVPIPGIATSTVRGYEMPYSGLDYYYDNLLFDWRTSSSVAVHSGLYRMHLFGFSSRNLTSQISTLPDDESSLVVRIDNTPPVMSINSIHYGSEEIGSCGVVQLEDATHALDVNVSAYDPDGYLHNLSLVGYYGDNQHFTCWSEVNPGTSPEWSGIMPNGDLTCSGDAGDHWETSCGYTFRVSGWGRAINGYTRIHYRSYQKTISVLMPDYTNPNEQVGLDDIIQDLRILTGGSTP